MYDHKEPRKKMSFIKDIAEPKKAYDKCHHILNPFNQILMSFQLRKLGLPITLHIRIFK